MSNNEGKGIEKKTLSRGWLQVIGREGLVNDYHDHFM
jgi:hypothetical protein